MIAPQLIAEIRRLYEVEGWRPNTIARHLEVHHRTVRSALETIDELSFVPAHPDLELAIALFSRAPDAPRKASRRDWAVAHQLLGSGVSLATLERP